MATADFQPFNLAQIYGAADQANNQKLQNQVLQMQMQKAQKSDADEEALKGAFNGAIGPDGTVDRKTLYANLYRVNPQKALEVQQAFSQQDLAAGKAKRENDAADITNRVNKSKYLRDTLANVTDQQSYENALNEAKTLGADFLTNSAPAQYDPNWVKGHVYDADKFITNNTPKFEKVDIGGKVQVVDMNPNTNPNLQGSSFDKTATPEALMTDERMRREGELNRGVTIRGQNLTNERAKETAQNSKGTYDAERGVIVDTRTGIARPVTQDGQEFTAKLPEAQQKQIVGVKNLSNAIAEYRNQLKTFKGLDALKPDARAAMGVKYNNMMLQAKEAYNLGVLNGPDFDILTSVVTDPRSFTGAITSNKALDSQAAELDRIMGGIATTTSQKQRASGASGNWQNGQQLDTIPNPSKLPEGSVIVDNVSGKRMKVVNGKLQIAQ